MNTYEVISLLSGCAALVLLFVLIRWFFRAREEARMIAWLAPAIAEAPIFFELIDISHDQSHYLERHGPLLRRCDVLERAQTGNLEVTGLKGRPVSSARWLRHSDLLRAIVSAAEHWRAGERPKGGRFVFEFDHAIGEGYPKNSDELLETRQAAVVIRKEFVLTAFPLLNAGVPSHDLQANQPIPCQSPPP